MWRRAAIAAALVGGLGALALSCGPSPSDRLPGGLVPPTTARTATTTSPVCPLTGAPAPGGAVPARAALGVKVDNAPSARPQAGLEAADVTYEEPVEGGLTRFLAVFQCAGAAAVGPVRSARLVDLDLLRPLGRPVFAYSGAIDPVLAEVAASGVFDVSQRVAPGAYRRDPLRAAPSDLMTSTEALWAKGAGAGAPGRAPAPLFPYGPLASPSPPIAGLQVAFSLSTIATWTWDPALVGWRRTAGGPAVTVANVIVQSVVLTPSRYVEDRTGAHEWLVSVTGSGPATVYRDGQGVAGSWSRPDPGDPTLYLDASGRTIPLRPGATWVELVPTIVAVSVTR